MSSVDPAVVARIAELAALDVPEADRAAITAEFAAIVGWIDTLAELPDTPAPAPPSAALALRSDVVTNPPGSDLLAVAPAVTEGRIVVPAVLED